MTVARRSHKTVHSRRILYYNPNPTVGAVLRATTIDQLNAAVQDFESTYGLQIVFDGRNAAGESSEGRVTYTPIPASQIDYIKQAVKQTVEEFCKYPPAFVLSTGIKSFYFVSSFTGTYAGYLAFTFGQYREIWCQLYTNLPNTGYGEGFDKYRNIVNHEFMHMIDFAYPTDYSNQKTQWESYNLTGFTYGNNKISPGFITEYANSAYIEDRAEIHTRWMSSHHYWSTQVTALADPRLAQKAQILRDEIRSKSSAWVGDPYKTASGDV